MTLGGLLLIALLATGTFGAPQAAAKPAFATVLGGKVGIDGPDVLERRFGHGVRVVRHSWLESRKAYQKDDGWNWWHWKAADADVQSCWEPAYPASRRRITSVWIIPCLGGLQHGENSIHPSASTIGWLQGIRMGMPKSDCLARLSRLFGKPTVEFDQYFWRVPGYEMSVFFTDGKLCELRCSTTSA